MTELAKELEALAALAQERPWTICEYNDGENLVIHAGADWRVCFMATPSSTGSAKMIDAAAKLIVTLANNLPTILTALRSAPAGDAVARDRYDDLVIAFRHDLIYLPEVPSLTTIAFLMRMPMGQDDRYFNRGKKLQRKHGPIAVPAKTEAECGVGRWAIMTEPLRTLPPATEEDAGQVAALVERMNFDAVAGEAEGYIAKLTEKRFTGDRLRRCFEQEPHARSAAVLAVDTFHGFTCEFSPFPAQHEAEYEAVERLLAVEICRHLRLTAAPSDGPVGHRDLEAENFALAAGQCCVPGGLVGDERGNPVCTVRKQAFREAAAMAEGLAPNVPSSVRIEVLELAQALRERGGE